MVRVLRSARYALVVGVLVAGVALVACQPVKQPGPGSEPDINIGNQALLLSDNTIFLNDIDYTCPAEDNGATILASVRQGSTVGFGTSSATCDGASHTAALDVGPGPFALGVEAAAAAALNLPGGGGPTQGNSVTPRAPDPAAVEVKNPGLLLTDGSVVLTATYRCVPGPGGNTAGTFGTGVIQGPNVSADNTGPAICDDLFHTVSTDNKGPQPFHEGSALSSAQVEDSTGSTLGGGGPITISS